MDFNPTLVQLESLTPEQIEAAKTNFNPTLVQLESSFHSQFLIHHLHFNPTLVQLEFKQRLEWTLYSRFQSHIGAIRMQLAEERRRISERISIPHWCN